MITYKLAKKLKDAGFPLREMYNLQIGFHTGLVKIDDVNYLMPDLSELIEACGEDFGALKRYTNTWKAGDCEADSKWGLGGHTDELSGNSACGKTPEEAVAKLWLNLKEV